MAEGILGEIPGGEEEKAGVEAPEALVGAEAFAAAVAARLCASDPEVSRKTAAYLTDQSELAKVQKRHLEQQHDLRLASLRNYIREQTLRRFGMRLRTAFPAISWHCLAPPLAAASSL